MFSILRKYTKLPFQQEKLGLHSKSHLVARFGITVHATPSTKPMPLQETEAKDTQYSFDI
jgi:hypothetical protein